MFIKQKFLLVLIIFCVFPAISFGYTKNRYTVQKDEQPVYRAVANGNLKAVMAFIVSNRDINIQNSYGDSLLTSSIFYKQLHITEYLISRGINLEIPNIEGNTALLASIMMGNIQTLNTLLKKGADVLVNNLSGEGILETAIRYQQYHILEFLLKTDVVDVNDFNLFRMTPLSYAVLLQDKIAIQLLLKYNADVNLRYINSIRTPFMIAAEQGDTSIMEILYRAGADITLRDGDNRDALFISIFNKKEDAALYLMQRFYTHYEFFDAYGQTPLTLAIANNMESLIQFLLSRNININTINAYGQTPLMVAASHGRFKILQLLVRYDESSLNNILLRDFIETVSDYPYRAYQYKAGWNILDIAEESLQKDIVEYLLSKGVKFHKGLQQEELLALVDKIFSKYLDDSKEEPNFDPSFETEVETEDESIKVPLVDSNNQLF